MSRYSGKQRATQLQPAMNGKQKELLELLSDGHSPYKRLEAYGNERKSRLVVMKFLLWSSRPR